MSRITRAVFTVIGLTVGLALLSVQSIQKSRSKRSRR